MAKAKKRKAKKRQAVSRAERVAATPETVAKLKRDYLQELLVRDPAKGIDEQEVEDLLEIEAAWSVIEAEIGGSAAWSLERSDGGGSHEMSDKAARLWAIWNAWATAFHRRTLVKGALIACWIRERDAIPGEGYLLFRTAARMWDAAKRTFDEDERRERASERALDATSCY